MCDERIYGNFLYFHWENFAANLKIAPTINLLLPAYTNKTKSKALKIKFIGKSDNHSVLDTSYF